MDLVTAAYMHVLQADLVERASQNSFERWCHRTRPCFVALNLVTAYSYWPVPPMRNQFLLNAQIVQLIGEGSIGQDAFLAPVGVVNGRM